jgi:hypothetical protein
MPRPSGAWTDPEERGGAHAHSFANNANEWGTRGYLGHLANTLAKTCSPAQSSVTCLMGDNVTTLDTRGGSYGIHDTSFPRLFRIRASKNGINNGSRRKAFGDPGVLEPHLGGPQPPDRCVRPGAVRTIYSPLAVP